MCEITVLAAEFTDSSISPSLLLNPCSVFCGSVIVFFFSLALFYVFYLFVEVLTVFNHSFSRFSEHLPDSHHFELFKINCLFCFIMVSYLALSFGTYSSVSFFLTLCHSVYAVDEVATPPSLEGMFCVA